MTKTEREIQGKLRVLTHAAQISDVSKACRYFGVARASFYRWKAAYGRHGEAGWSIGRPRRRIQPIGQRWSHFLRQAAKVDSLMQRTNHHEDAETVFG